MAPENRSPSARISRRTFRPTRLGRGSARSQLQRNDSLPPPANAPAAAIRSESFGSGSGETDLKTRDLDVPRVGLAASHGGSAASTRGYGISDVGAPPLQLRRQLPNFKLPTILASVSASHATHPSLAPRFGPNLLPSQPDSDDVFPLSPASAEELQRAVIGWLEEQAMRARNLRNLRNVGNARTTTAEAGGQAQVTPPRASALALEAHVNHAVTSAHARIGRARVALARAVDGAVTTARGQLAQSARIGAPLLVSVAGVGGRMAVVGERVAHAKAEAEARMLALRRFGEFWCRIVHIYGSYKVCQLHTSFNLPLPGNRRLALVKETEREAIWERQHERAANMLHSLCTEMRGFFLKAGQFLAKPDMSPPAWVARLSSLHDAAPADPFPVVCEMIEGELEALMGRKGLRWSDVFARIEEEPLGSASIAQVHRAWLKDGRQVALKVQHKGSEPLMLMDLANLKAFGAFLQKTELKHMDIVSALVELEKQVRLEFDFRIEANAMERIHLALKGEGERGGRRKGGEGGTGGAMVRRKGAAAAVRGRTGRGRGAERRSHMDSFHLPSATSSSSSTSSPVVVPRPIPGLATRRVLVMHLIEGSPLLKAAEEMGAKAEGFFARRIKRSIFRSLGEAYGLMLLRDGYFQADPHPGNILICPDKKVALLDYGQTKQLSQQHRLQLAELILAVGDGDAKQIGRLYKQMGFELSKTAEENPDSFRWMATLMFDTRSAPGITTSNPFSAEHVGQSNGVRKFPEDLFFVVRTMQLLRGICMGMGLNESLAEQWRPIARQAIKEAQRQQQ
ncbi:hypothetical protein CLOM_g210 [Closterium sp. NIES-68]|nr:hypothetical protein CLOM_g210 [Closterium sp. NIES-68]GJP68031.1 hypothetical protein CLOP_g24788 [Closterium sp. NIES-67]